MIWRCGTFELDLAEGPLLMGILNVTPDSFSDGYPTLEAALVQGREMVQAGAHIIDVGGESTRPGSSSVPAAEEIARVVPVIRALRAETAVPISVDTQKHEVAREALAAGADIINHVSASLDVDAMVEVLIESEAGYVGMHMAARPKTMQANPLYDDVVESVTGALLHMKTRLEAAGIHPSRLLFDPGIGFGKTLEHNLALLGSLDRMAERLQRPLLLGVSRKSWLTHLLDVAADNLAERDAHTALTSVLAPFPAVAVHRVHHVALVRDAFKLAQAAFGGPGANFFKKK